MDFKQESSPLSVLADVKEILFPERAALKLPWTEKGYRMSKFKIGALTVRVRPQATLLGAWAVAFQWRSKIFLTLCSRGYQWGRDEVIGDIFHARYIGTPPVGHRLIGLSLVQQGRNLLRVASLRDEAHKVLRTGN